MSKKKRATKKKRPDQIARKAFRKASDTHMAIFELDVTHQQIRELLRIAFSVAYIKRRLNAYYRRRLEQYKRTRTYKQTIKEYRTATTKKRKTELARTLTKLQIEQGITEEAGRDLASYYAKRTGIQSVFALTAFEDVWRGVERVLYKGAHELGNKRDDSCLTIRAKQANRSILIKHEDDHLAFDIEGVGLMLPKIKKDDLFLLEEQSLIIREMTDASIEKGCIRHFLKTGEIVGTYRAKYATIKLERVRDKWRVYAQVAVEGRARSKKRKDGSPRYRKAMSGEVAIDLGVQSYAAVGANILEMKNLSERCGKAMRGEAKLRRLQRHLDRSRRAMNPECYNEDGTIKKGRKEWIDSKEYERTRELIRAYHRKCALNRKYAIQEDVNRLREHGDVIVSEKQLVRGWQSSLFGRSVQSRCPGAFRAELKRKFLDYIEVDIMYRASQYDHERDIYEKKKLSQRKHEHSQGRASPRDLYSGFLLWCHDVDYQSPDRDLCKKRFDDYLVRVEDFVGYCRDNAVRVCNSGF